MHIYKKKSTFAPKSKLLMRTFGRILIWVGIMAGLTLIAMLIWHFGWQGSQTTESLKWLQFLQTIGTFLLPPILCAWMWDVAHKPFSWLKLDTRKDHIQNRKSKILLFVIAIVMMIVAIPGINLLADLNSRIELPKSLDFIEQFFKQQEDAAAALTERFLQADNVWQLMINIGLLALLPALAEELSFRGTLQQLLTGESSATSGARTHIAIWTSAIIFSAIHMQFYGFIPRMLMGALFGYMFVWTGSLWVPIVMHFTNNGIAVIAYYLFDEIGENSKSYADTIGAGTTWWIGLISLIAVVTLIVFLLTSLDLPGYVRRTHKQ